MELAFQVSPIYLVNKPFLHFMTGLDNRRMARYSCNICGFIFWDDYSRVVAHFIGNKRIYLNILLFQEL